MRAVDRSVDVSADLECRVVTGGRAAKPCALRPPMVMETGTVRSVRAGVAPAQA